MDETWRTIGQRIVTAARLATAMHLGELFTERWRDAGAADGVLRVGGRRGPAESLDRIRNADDDPRAGAGKEAG